MGFASANAVYYADSNQIVVYNWKEITMEQLYTEINNETLLSHDDNKIWYLNASLRIPYGSIMHINNSSVSQLRISNYKGQTGLYDGTYLIENVTIGSWDNENSRYAKKDEKQVGIAINEGILQNSNLIGLKYIGLNDIIDDVYNISAVDCYKGLVIQDTTNKQIRNISLENISESAIYCLRCNDTEIYDIYIKDAGNYLIPATGAYGIVYDQYSNNSSIHDVFVNGTGWSAIDSTSGSSNIHIYNATIYNAGHNGIDIHGGHDVLVENVSIYDSVSNNILATYSKNITFKNIYSYGAVGNSIQAGYQISNVTFINITSLKNEGDYTFFDIEDVKLLNISSSINPCGIVFTTISDKAVINGTIMDICIKYPAKIELSYSTNSKLINVLSEILFYPGRINEGTVYYYPDISVKNSSNAPISSSKIIFSNEINSSLSSVNGWGENRNEFYTTSKGHTQLPNNDRKDSPAIAEYYKNSNGKLSNLSHTVTISNIDGNSVSLSGITPDSSWYRKDPNVPTYTITAIIPDNSSKGPHIIGFAPSMDNPFNIGDKKNFRIWTDGTLKEMNWFVDGKQVASRTLNYTWNVGKDVNKIEFRGADANGNVVSQIWKFREESGDKTTNQTASNPPTSDDSQTSIIKFLPENNSLTKNISEPVTFSVNSSQLLTKKWYVNETMTQSNTTAMTKSWDTAGIYNVTFSGSTGEELVTNTWIVKVINFSNISITPEYQVVSPKKQFALNIKIEPGTTIKSAQSDLLFQSSMVKINNVSEGNLFSQSGANTGFSNGTVNSSAGLIKQICGSIMCDSSVSSPGTLATINLTAGSSTGVAKFNLSNVAISGSDSGSLPYAIKNATVLIDTAPVLGSIGSKSVYETKKLTFNVKASDADGNRLILSASDLPSGAKFNQTTGTFIWTPSKGQAGTYTVTFKVSDGYLTDSENVKITVKQVNCSPVITSFVPANKSSFKEGQQIKIAVKASDKDKQTLKYTIKVDGTTRSTSSSYIWKTNSSSSGKHTIEVTVSDGIEKVKKVNTIYIKNYCPC